MEMVKLKMGTIYKTFLTCIGFLIFFAIAIGVLYLFYDKALDFESDIEVHGNLSINYIDGKHISVEDKLIMKFSVTNGSNDISYYNIGFMQIRGNGKYKILDDDKVVTEGEVKSIDEITTNDISIDSNETKLYTLEVINTGDTILTGKLNIRNQQGKTVTFADTILNNNTYAEDALTKVGSEVATEDEGLIKSIDDLGTSYYFRGNVTNNYVSFGGLLWRIIRINGDGTVRVILDGATDILASYYNENNSNFEFEKSEMNNYLENWLEENLSDYKNYIANSKFCSDISHDELYNYNSYARIITNKIPTFNCLGTSISNNIGLITVDEVVHAGGSPISYNKNYYLYNSEIENAWYTMTASKGSAISINMFMVDNTGSIKTEVTGNLYRNVRPVINLIKNIEMEGKGLKEEPYVMVME